MNQPSATTHDIHNSFADRGIAPQHAVYHRLT